MIRLSIVEVTAGGSGRRFEPSGPRRPAIGHAGRFEHAPSWSITGRSFAELLDNSFVVDGMIGRGRRDTHRFIGDHGVFNIKKNTLNATNKVNRHHHGET